MLRLPADLDTVVVVVVVVLAAAAVVGSVCPPPPGTWSLPGPESWGRSWS